MNGKVRYFRLPQLGNLSKKIQEDCYRVDSWEIKKSEKQLGEGSYGTVYQACQNSTCSYVGKVIRFDFRYDKKFVWNVFFAEAKITQYAGLKGFGIPVHKYYLCDEGKKGVIISDRFDGDLDDLTLTEPQLMKVLRMIHKMHQHGILHRDLFPKNVMFKQSGEDLEFRIIDFGLSIAFNKSIPAILRGIDFINFIDSLSSTLKEVAEPYIIKVVGEKYYQEAKVWKTSHHDQCSSEYYLLKHLPVYLYKIYGPAVTDLLVWSVRCSPEHDQQITTTLEKRLVKKKLPIPY